MEEKELFGYQDKSPSFPSDQYFLYEDCYFEDYMANDMFNDLINGRDFNSFMEMGIATEEELEYLKEEYGIEDEETTKA